MLVALAERSPVLLVIEDAQWAEPGLLDLVEDVTSGDLRVPLVALVLARDELLASRPGWGARSRNATVVTLDAIDDGEMLRLAAAISGNGSGDDAIELAGGNPFFLEEILHMRGEGGGAVVPETVHGVIAARLDLLSPDEKRLLQRAAVVGRTFSKDHLAAVDVDTPERLLGGLAARDMVQPLGSEWAFKHMLIRDVAYESLVRTDKARLHLALARWLEQGGPRRPSGDRHHYAVAAGLGLSEARSDAVRLLLDAAFDARRAGAHGLGLRQAERALALAADDRERCASYEAVGDAYWMAEQIEKAFEAYDRALEHGVAAGLPPADMARLRWKWADAPTRWSASKAMAATRERIEDEIARGLDDAAAAGDEAMEARLLTAGALFTWRVETSAEPQELALTVADRALEIAERLGRPGTTSAARDARTVLLHALNRYDEAAENDEARFALLPKIRWREEQMDVCAASARTRQALGDFAGSVEAVRKAEQLTQRDDPRWLSLPARILVETYFLWDRWDDALDSYERFLDVFRRTAAARRQAMIGGVASGAVAGVHILRGEQERAERIEQRMGAGGAPGVRPDVRARAARHRRAGAGARPRARPQGQPLARMGDRGGGARHAGRPGRARPGARRGCATSRSSSGCRAWPRSSTGPAGSPATSSRCAARRRRSSELGCRFERARCLELLGQGEEARLVYEAVRRRAGALPGQVSSGSAR